jgi:two-component system, NarL family, sensor kinase
MNRFIFLYLLLFSNSLFSQQELADSLRKELKAQLSDTSRANTLCQLAWTLADVDAKEGLETSKQALTFSKEKGLKKNIGIAYNAMAFNLNMLGQMPEAIKAYNASIVVWSQLKDSLRIAKAYSNIGNVYSEMPVFDSAQKYYQRSIEICKKQQFQKPLSSAYLNLASLYISRNRYTESIRLLLASLKIKQEVNDQLGIANVCSHISTVYKEQKNYRMALSYGFESVRIWSELHNENGLSYAKMALGLIYHKMNRQDSALIYTTDALNDFERINNQLGITTGYNRLGMIYFVLKQPNKAILYFEKGKEKSKNPFIAETYVEACSKLAPLYSETGQLDLALKNLDSAIAYINSDINKNTIKNIYQEATDYFTKVKEYPLALQYSQLYNALKDSLINEENFGLTAELQFKYEAEKKETENQKLKYENKLSEAELVRSAQQKKWIFGFFTLLIVGLIGIFYFVVKNNKAKQKLRQQELISNTTFETERNERTRIARELHDGIGQKLSVVKMQLSMNPSDTNGVQQLVDETIRDVRNVSHDLMPEEIKKGLVPAVENLSEQINYTNSTTQTLLSISEAFRNRRFNEKIELYLYRIIQEIVNNALKHAEAKNIHISMDIEGDMARVIVKDDGIGYISNDRINKEGIGIKNIQSRVEALKGMLKHKSEKGEGTNYQILIPVR